MPRRAAIRCSGRRSEQFPGEAFDRASLKAAAADLLTDEGEIALIRKLAEYPRLIEAAALAHEPHRLAFYLYDLASSLPRTLESRHRESRLTFC